MRPGRSGHCNRGPEVPCCPGQEGQGWGRGRRRPPSPPQRRQAHSYQADGEGAPGKRVGSRVHSRTRGRCSGTLRQMPLPRGRAWIGGCQGPGASIYLKPALRLGSQFTRSFNKHGALAGDQTAAMSAASLAEPTGSSASGRTKAQLHTQSPPPKRAFPCKRRRRSHPFPARTFKAALRTNSTPHSSARHLKAGEVTQVTLTEPDCEPLVPPLHPASEETKSQQHDTHPGNERRNRNRVSGL
ncbi:uncharacterized protein LOC122233769 isoform X2 [Panthera tigris]|uniref:uncharacterized protein LOC122233769 isoform X2 n=1 Tax=Panthera tigris TaxID=9694 RepID=UPI001C6FA9BB|nr:uncharacterized protein LOC122233769 isoform X2 [Panthera tigris]